MSQTEDALSPPPETHCECPPDILGRHFLDCMLRRDRARAERAEGIIKELIDISEKGIDQLTERARKAEKKNKRLRAIVAELRAIVAAKIEERVERALSAELREAPKPRLRGGVQYRKCEPCDGTGVVAPEATP